MFFAQPLCTSRYLLQFRQETKGAFRAAFSMLILAASACTNLAASALRDTILEVGVFLLGCSVSLASPTAFERILTSVEGACEKSIATGETLAWQMLATHMTNMDSHDDLTICVILSDSDTCRSWVKQEKMRKG